MTNKHRTLLTNTHEYESESRCPHDTENCQRNQPLGKNNTSLYQTSGFFYANNKDVDFLGYTDND